MEKFKKAKSVRKASKVFSRFNLYLQFILTAILITSIFLLNPGILSDASATLNWRWTIPYALLFFTFIMVLMCILAAVETWMERFERAEVVLTENLASKTAELVRLKHIFGLEKTFLEELSFTTRVYGVTIKMTPSVEEVIAIRQGMVRRMDEISVEIKELRKKLAVRRKPCFIAFWERRAA